MQTRLFQAAIVVLCLTIVGLVAILYCAADKRDKKMHARHVVEVVKSTILRENSGLATDITQKYATRGEYEWLTSERDLARDDADFVAVYRQCLRIISGANNGPSTDERYGALRLENKDFGFCFSVLEARKDLDNFVEGMNEGSLSANFVLKEADQIEVRIRVKATELRKEFYNPTGLHKITRTN